MDAADLMDWDDEVDVLCVGDDAAGSAAAVASQALGLTAAVVRTASGDRPQPGDLPARLGLDDADTVAYLRSVTDDIAPTAPGSERPRETGELPIRFVDTDTAAAGTRASGAVTFVGASLRTWASKCLASPGGVLSTYVADPRLTTTYRASGHAVEAVVLGSVDFGAPAPPAFEDWLASRARHHDVLPEVGNTLQRLLFSDGDVVGAMVDTPSGPNAVRARFGVVMTLGAVARRCAWPSTGLDGVTSAEVAFVAKAASRFAQLELLVPLPAPR